MCLRTSPDNPCQCDCYECVEGRKATPARSRDGECCRPQSSSRTDTVESWSSAYGEAYRQVQLEIFKAKIKKDLSKTMEKTAAVIMETMLAETRENIRRARFQKDLRAKLEKLIASADGD